MTTTERNIEMVKMAKKGSTLQQIADYYETTTSNVSTILNREGYRKIEINDDLEQGKNPTRRYK